jgi:hypothetical protein
MYADPSNIRKHLVPLRVNDRNNELIEKLAQMHGKQRATIAHDLFQLGLQLATEELEEQTKQLNQLSGLAN